MSTGEAFPLSIMPVQECHLICSNLSNPTKLETHLLNYIVVVFPPTVGVLTATDVDRNVSLLQCCCDEQLQFKDAES